jgi:hypothetical protein
VSLAPSGATVKVALVSSHSDTFLAFSFGGSPTLIIRPRSDYWEVNFPPGGANVWQVVLINRVDNTGNANRLVATGQTSTLSVIAGNGTQQSQAITSTSEVATYYFGSMGPSIFAPPAVTAFNSNPVNQLNAVRYIKITTYQVRSRIHKQVQATVAGLSQVGPCVRTASHASLS